MDTKKRTRGWLRTRVLIAIVVVFVVGCGQAERLSAETFGSVIHVDAVHTLTPETHGLASVARVTWEPASLDTFFFLLHSGLEIGEIRTEGNLPFGELQRMAEGDGIADRLAEHSTDAALDGVDHLVLYGVPMRTEADSVMFAISYNGTIYDDVEVPEFSRWSIADETTGLIDTAGAFLLPSTGYYPSLPVAHDLARYSSTLRYPEGWEGLAEGNRTARSETLSRYDSVHPLDGAHLVAGPYDLVEEEHEGVTVAMLHFDQGEELIDRYLTHSARYLAMYTGRIGEYPFDRFTVVENWFPTGYGMPSFTLLGTDVLALPFIVYTSLGHEVLHNWWGNGVLVDYDNGNWCEGLTVYQADYEYAGARNPTGMRQYRLDLLRDYSDYVVHGDDDDFPLREFTSRTTAGSRTIGYGKVMMVFHMAQRMMGRDAFEHALRTVYTERRFDVTRWSHFFDTFAAVSEVPREQFTAFEEQWVDRPGAPRLAVHNPVATSLGEEGGYLVEFDVEQTQDGDPFTFDLPVRFSFSSDSSREHVLRNVNGTMYHARVQTADKPTTIAVDPDFHLFREIDPLEAPPTLSGFFGAETVTAILPAEDDPLRDVYRELAESLLGSIELTIVDEGDPVPEGVPTIRLGSREGVRTVLSAPGMMEPAGEGEPGLALVWASRNPDRPNLVHAHVWASTPDALGMLARKLPHYGKYSYLAFRSGQNIGKGQWDVTESPLIVALP